MPTIEIRPGEGGADAAAFARELASTITAYLRREGHTPCEATSPDARTIIVRTDAPHPTVGWLAGTHRVQRVPSRSAARHTSTATVAVLTDREEGKHRVGRAGEEVKVDRYRGHGAGGQRKNKVSTAIRLTHPKSGIVITRETGRSQHANLVDAQRDFAAQLSNRATAKRAARQQSARRTQVRSDRSAKTFTHNHQRGEVLDHQTGKRWTLKEWARGRLQ